MLSGKLPPMMYVYVAFASADRVWVVSQRISLSKSFIESGSAFFNMCSFVNGVDHISGSIITCAPFFAALYTIDAADFKFSALSETALSWQRANLNDFAILCLYVETLIKFIIKVKLNNRQHVITS